MLSSTPRDPREGSGTFVSIDGLARGLERLGHEVCPRPLRFRSGVHTLDRWLYNAGVCRDPPVGDLVLGVDLDGFLWARRRRLPFVVSLKGIIADELVNERGRVRALLALQARWERKNTERADLVLVTSRSSAAVARRAYGVPEARLAVLPEPINLDAWAPALARARRRPRGHPVVLCVARFYPRKRIEDLLRAAARLRVRLPSARLRVVGRGPTFEAARRLHRELGLGEAVTLLGDVTWEALVEEYANADAFCLPSVQEGFGVVFLEAMAAGLPVVACRISAIPELVRDGETGLLVPPRDPEALAGALETLLHDAELRHRLGVAGRARVPEFAAEQIARRFLDAVQSQAMTRGSAS
ncbi:MAG: glycosyltransferase family 4 protein [Candidatus Rokubacteria bacterium]|nr:glycosyltransferase family 4 protein [Candidatus Rokubacteria bacterium]